MRKSAFVLGALLVIAMGLFAYTVLQPASEPENSLVEAQDMSQPPIFENEVYEWCVGSCNGGNDNFSPNQPADFEMRENGSLHFMTDVNFSACPSLVIPDGIEGWYFGTLQDQVENALATATVTSEVVEWETTGVQPLDDAARDNPDLMICEALFFRGE